MRIWNIARSGAAKPWFPIAAILILAFLLRLVWRLHGGGAGFWTDGYVLFDRIARNVVAGHGLLLGNGSGWAFRPPVYPLVLAAAHLVGGHWLAAVLFEALFSVGTVFGAYLIGRHLSGQRVGLIAAFGVAVYPYFVVHDTALQETGVLTCFTTLATYYLLKARRSTAPAVWLAAGALIALAAMTRLTVLPFTGLALLWLVWGGEGGLRQRGVRAITVALPLVVIVGGWVVRNDILVGAPILSSEAGAQLWMAHNPYTFSRYPEHSIDESSALARAAFTPQEQQELRRLGELERDRWFRRKALAYMADRPLDGVAHAWRKLAAGFSWTFNPGHSRGVQLVYFVSYGFALITGLFGLLVLRGGSSRDRWLIYLHYIAFAGCTALYWAHTSHRTYLDVYLIVFGAFTLDRYASPFVRSRIERWRTRA